MGEVMTKKVTTGEALDKLGLDSQTIAEIISQCAGDQRDNVFNCAIRLLGLIDELVDEARLDTTSNFK